MPLFTPEQFAELHTAAVSRETASRVVIEIKRTDASEMAARQGARYYRLLKHNEHYWATRFAMKYEDRKTIPLISQMINAGVLKLDMSKRLAVRKPYVGDLELAALVK